MTRTCQICQHPKRAEIDKRLLAGESLRSLARQYETDKSALLRHKKHVAEDLAKAQEAEEVSHSDDLLDQLRKLKDRAMRILDKAEEAKQLGMALGAIREIRGVLETFAKLSGQLQETATVNITVNPEWLQLRTVILDAVDPYPEAKDKLIQAFGGADVSEN